MGRPESSVTCPRCRPPHPRRRDVLASLARAWNYRTAGLLLSVADDLAAAARDATRTDARELRRIARAVRRLTRAAAEVAE